MAGLAVFAWSFATGPAVTDSRPGAPGTPETYEIRARPRDTAAVIPTPSPTLDADPTVTSPYDGRVSRLKLPKLKSILSLNTLAYFPTISSTYQRTLADRVVRRSTTNLGFRETRCSQRTSTISQTSLGHSTSWHTGNRRHRHCDDGRRKRVPLQGHTCCAI